MTYTLRLTAIFTVLALLFCSAAACAEDKLVLVVTLIRHGDRTPCHAIPKHPYDWKLGLGELTALGINQEYTLGKSFRAKYVEQLAFLPDKFDDRLVYARSTNYNRTLMSAQSFLCGLYPPGTGPLLDNGCPALPYGYQPIPVRTVPEAQDTVLLGNRIYKKQVDELISRHVFTTDYWIRLTSAFKGNFERWGNLFGIKVNTLRDLIKPGDDLNVRLLKGVPLPAGLTEQDARDLAMLFNVVLARECRPRKIGCLVSKGFIIELTDLMEKAIEGKSEYKFVLYSAHDTTMLPVLSAIGAPQDNQVPYASNVSFELYRNESGHYMKAAFNGREIKFPFADDKTTCTVGQFRKGALDDSW